jgi:hypothetical protein
MTGLTTGLGAAAGALAAVAVLTHRAIAWNVVAVTAAVWLLALVSVAPSLGLADSPPAVRLGVLDPAWLDVGLGQRLAVVTMPALALAAGATLGALARWRAHAVMPAAASGAAGSALLAVSYLAAGPGESTDTFQAAPYWGALLAVGAGALGSVLAAVTRLPERGGRTGEAADELAAGDLPRDDIPPDDLSSDDLPRDDLPAGDLPRADLPRADLPRADLPRDEVPSDGQTDRATSEPAHDDVDPGDRRPDESVLEPAAATSTVDRVRQRNRVAAPIPDRDADYVDWVTGLAAPDHEPEDQPWPDGPARHRPRSAGTRHGPD